MSIHNILGKLPVSSAKDFILLAATADIFSKTTSVFTIQIYFLTNNSFVVTMPEIPCQIEVTVLFSLGGKQNSFFTITGEWGKGWGRVSFSSLPFCVGLNTR